MQASLLSALMLTTSAIAAPWEAIAPLPAPNAGFVCGAMGEEVLVAGGTNWEGGTKQWLREVHVYSPRANTWRTLPPLEQPLAYAAFGSDGTRLVYAGGSSGEATLSAVSVIDRAFARSSVALQPRLVYADGALIGNELFVAGGAPAQDDLSQLTDAAYAIDPQTGQARPLAPVPGPGSAIGASAACGGKLYVFGGARWDAAGGEVRNLATAYVYDPARNAWERLPDLPRANRGITATSLDEHRVLLAGGYADEAFTDETFVFDTRAPGYRPGPPLPYRALVALVRCGEHVYCLGGEDAKKHRTAAAYRIPASAFSP